MPSGELMTSLSLDGIAPMDVPMDVAWLSLRTGEARTGVVRTGGGISPLSLEDRLAPIAESRWKSYLSDSLIFVAVFFLFGLGILHSMLKATQFVHGTPRLAASQRTLRAWQVCLVSVWGGRDAPGKVIIHLASSGSTLSIAMESVIARLIAAAWGTYLLKPVDETPCACWSPGVGDC